jgi:hypothetical protein
VAESGGCGQPRAKDPLLRADRNKELEDENATITPLCGLQLIMDRN